jgi:metal-responsive CopG/Arc/MetJ family transcriptional regulator
MGVSRLQRGEDVIVSFRINKNLLEEFDRFLENEGVYIRSEGLRKLVINALKRGNEESF